jgi:hypothetical protein
MRLVEQHERIFDVRADHSVEFLIYRAGYRSGNSAPILFKFQPGTKYFVVFLSPWTVPSACVPALRKVTSWYLMKITRIVHLTAFSFMPSVCNVGWYSLAVFTCHLQVYRLLWWRNLLLTVMPFCFSCVVASDYFRLCGLTSCFIWVSLELYLFALSVICDELCQSFILRYICIFNYCEYAVTYGFVGWFVAVLNILVEAGVYCRAVGHHSRSF